jgi:Ca-activated chloride channel family protein
VEDLAMKFLYPGALWWLVLVPIAYFILLWDEKRRLKSFEAFASRSLWPAIVPEINSRARFQKITLFLLAAVFAIIAMARPQWGTQEEVAKMSGLDIMVVLDISNSMETEDVIPSRLKKAKHFLRTLAERVQGDRLGLVTFAGGASVATPLTTDTEYFLEQLQIQNPRTIPTQGTDIGLGLETAARAMDRGAAQSGQGKEEIPSRAIVLISDGEDFEGSARNAAAALKAQGIRLYAFGVGTEKGGPVPVRDDSGSLINYKRDRSGKPVISTFHPDDLVQVAAAAGGRYWNITVDESEITDLLKDLGALTRGEFSEHRYLVYKERFQYPLSIAVLLLLIEMSLSVRSSSNKKKIGSAAALLVFVLASAGALPGSAQAAGIETYQENKKGIEAYKSGKIEEAQKEFGAAQARDPNLPELQYNQGLVHMQQGDTDAAIHDFQEAARGAMKSGKSDLLSKDFFNLGSALSKKGDLKGALQSYLAAIGSAKKNGDAQLEQDARKNIELLIQQQKQQKQQQQQQQNQQQQQQQQQNQQQQQQNQQNQQNQQQQKQQGQNQQDQNKKDQKDQQKDQQKGQKDQEPKQFDSSSSRGKKFESQKLAPEDAERVLSELKNREKDLQGRMKKQNGNYSSQNNDW